MFYKDFHGHKISGLGLGCMRFPTVEGDKNTIDREKAQKIVDAAIAGGINYFDTAHLYQRGDSERFLGEALKKYPRDSFYLATKFYGSQDRDIATTFEEQLARLQTDYVDFYLLHCLTDETVPFYTDRVKDYIGYLLEQKKAGRIRYLGFSTHATIPVLKRLLDYYDGFDMALMQLNYVDWTVQNAKEQYALLRSHGIPIWVMEPLKGSRLASLNDGCNAILKEASPDRSIASWSFRWLMGLEGVQTVLSGMTDEAVMADNLATFSKIDPLTEKERSALDRATQALFATLGVPCSACRYCCDGCPAGLDIPRLMGMYNECSITGETWRLPEPQGDVDPGACLQCGACTAHCPQRIDVPGIMQKLQEKLTDAK